MTWLRKKTIPGFAPRGDEVIGNTRQGQAVTISQEFWRWLSLLATRLQNNVVAPGTIQMTAAAVEPEGWLFLNGQTVDANLYPSLADIFGSSAGVVALPNYGGRISMGAGSIVALNETAGNEKKTLTVDELPAHAHDVRDLGHAHPIADSGHTHAAIDRGHSHRVVIDSHDHGVTDPGHSHDAAERSATSVDAGGAGARDAADSTTSTEITGITVDDAETEGFVMASRADISVHRARSNVSVVEQETGIEIEETGGGQEFSLIPPVFGVNWMVKT